MDEAAPIQWLILKITTLVGTAVNGVASTLTTTITPLVAVCFGIYIILISVNYMRGAEQEPVMDFLMRFLTFAIVISLGLSYSTYATHIMPIVTDMGSGLAAALTGGSATASSLDQLALHYLDIINKGFEDATAIHGLDGLAAYIQVAVKSFIIILGLAPFLIAATLYIITASVFSQIIAALGPLFFAFLLFPATRQYFTAWVNTAFSYILIPTIIAIISLVSVEIAKEMLSDSSGTLVETSFKSVFLAAICNLILLFLLRQVSSLASALSAGGINAGMPGSVGSMANSARASIRGTKQDARDIKSAYQGTKNMGSSMYKAVANKFNSIRKAG
ncbi:type IV secretion system protein [Methylotenera sp.]|uniref:type IV secretion system protein n=1 Tax=Methylotenera sp. TaxID=2051956 RepID=UPI0024874BEC|nr:type IV secretion system protein [Methylotenera sp.]MDI1298622.1 type IV secretion system protein [Methylotenera sp.]